MRNDSGVVSSPRSYQERVLISAAVKNDSRLTADFLRRAGFQAQICADVADLCQKIDEGCGLIVIAEDLLQGKAVLALGSYLDRQPSWSDIPVTVITSTGNVSEKRVRDLAGLGNVTLLERPFRPGTLISNVEVALRSRRRQYQVRDLVEEREAMVASISDAFASFDLEWRCTFLNERAALLAGEPREKILGRKLWHVFPDLEDTDVHRQLTGPGTQQDSIRMDSFHARLGRWLEVRIYPSSKGTSVFATDITDRKESEDALREARGRLEATLAGADIGTWIWDVERDCVIGDANVAQFFALPPDQPSGPLSSFLRAVHPEDRVRVEKEIERALSTGAFELDYRIAQSDGGVRWVTVRGKLERNGSGKPSRFSGVIIDVTERRKQQEAIDHMSRKLEEQAEIFDKTLSNINDFAYVLDQQGRFLYANKPLLNLWGLTLQEVMGKDSVALGHDPHQAARLQCQIQEVVKTKRGIKDEVHYISPAGIEGFYEYILTPVFSPDGHVEVIVGSTRDVTERRNVQNELERRVQERTAELTETNSQLETLVYSIAHDLRAPLRSMQAFSKILLDDYASDLDEMAQQYARRILRSAETMDALVLDLLNYGRIARADLKMEPVKVERAWQLALEQHREQIERQQARIETIQPLPVVLAHETTLAQVLANLLGNALKFARQGTQPSVRLRPEHMGASVRLWVEDDGIGIAPEYHERIFRVFERLHGSEYGGTGIGLSIVRKGMERMGGQVGLESAPGQGSRFWLELVRA